MTIGEQIKTARLKSNLTQKELCQRSGVAAISIQQYERGAREPRMEQLIKIANALNVSIDELMGSESMPQTADCFVVSPSEQDIIKKYRALDKHGKEMVDFVLEKEAARAKEPRKESEFVPAMMVARSGESGIVIASKDTMKDADLSDADDL